MIIIIYPAPFQMHGHRCRRSMCSGWIRINYGALALVASFKLSWRQDYSQDSSSDLRAILEKREQQHKDQPLESGDHPIGGVGPKACSLPQISGKANIITCISGEVCRDFPDPGGCSKSLCEKMFVLSFWLLNLEEKV